MNVYAKPTTCEATFRAAKVVMGSFSSAEMPPALSQSKVMDLKAMKKLEQELVNRVDGYSIGSYNKGLFNSGAVQL
jgi:hypothetical protein